MTALDLALCFITTGLLLLTTAAHTCPHDTPTLRLTARQATCVSSMFAPTPTQVEGPFYLTSPVRADITEGRAGAPLRVTVAVKDRNCRSLSAGTRVAIWHADSKGVYSGFRSKPDNEGKIFDERGTTFLRGELAVDEDGKAVFDTIVPGWYSNRPVHIHMKVFHGGAKELTTQLYFKDEFLREVGALAEYAERGDPDTTNEDEDVPAALIVEVKGDSRSGYAVEYAVGVNVDAGDAGDAGGAGDAHDARDARDADQVGRSSGSCFPADAVVVLENGEEKRMADLDVGDRVLVGAGAVSDVFAFTHRTTGTVNEFVTVSLESGESISMTPGHYLHVDGALVAASSVRPGATVRRASGGEGVVSAVRREMLSGLYNPQTLDGDIVVNGVVASTYTTAVKPAVAHRALGALRMSYRLSGRVDLTFGWLENGVGAAGRKALDTVGLRGALVEQSNAQNIACKY